MRVLVIEDEYKIANALKKGLSAEGYAVDVVYNGDDGLASGMEASYDIVICDRMLPGGYDGIAIVKSMRADNVMTPVLMLLARIRALIRNGQQKKDSPVLAYKELELNLITKQAKRSDISIVLSLKEFSLLDYLMRNPEVVLTKQQIIEHVWDYDADILENNVEAFIGMLRKKIDKPFKGKSYIQTMRGFGYKLEESR